VDLLVAVALFALQAILIAPLFTGEFTLYRGSIEAAYISDARFIVDHFPDLSWNPFWYLGFPFEWFYTPLLPGLVALVGKLIGDVPSAYRLVAATGYALGPLALYVATREIARSRAAAWFAALAFVFLPSISYLLPGLQADASAFSGAALPPPWRLVALVEYGDPAALARQPPGGGDADQTAADDRDVVFAIGHRRSFRPAAVPVRRRGRAPPAPAP